MNFSIYILCYNFKIFIVFKLLIYGQGVVCMDSDYYCFRGVSWPYFVNSTSYIMPCYKFTYNLYYIWLGFIVLCMGQIKANSSSSWIVSLTKYLAMSCFLVVFSMVLPLRKWDEIRRQTVDASVESSLQHYRYLSTQNISFVKTGYVAEQKQKPSIYLLCVLLQKWNKHDEFDDPSDTNIIMLQNTYIPHPFSRFNWSPLA